MANILSRLQNLFRKEMFSDYDEDFEKGRTRKAAPQNPEGKNLEDEQDARWEAARTYMMMDMYEDAEATYDRILSVAPMERAALWGKLMAMTARLTRYALPEEKLAAVQETGKAYLEGCGNRKNQNYTDLEDYLRAVMFPASERKERLFQKREELARAESAHFKSGKELKFYQQDVEENNEDIACRKGLSGWDIALIVLTPLAVCVLIILTVLSCDPAFIYLMGIWVLGGIIGLFFVIRERLAYWKALKESVELAGKVLENYQELMDSKKRIEELKAEIEAIYNESEAD